MSIACAIGGAIVCHLHRHGLSDGMSLASFIGVGFVVGALHGFFGRR